MDIEHQGRGAGIAVGVGKGVGEGLSAIGCQRQERRIAGVDGVGVGAVGRQHQLAVGAVDGLRGDRPGRYPIRALGVVAQHITAKDGLRFTGSSRVAVAHRRRHIVDDAHVQ